MYQPVSQIAPEDMNARNNAVQVLYHPPGNASQPYDYRMNVNARPTAVPMYQMINGFGQYQPVQYGGASSINGPAVPVAILEDSSPALPPYDQEVVFCIHKNTVFEEKTSIRMNEHIVDITSNAQEEYHTHSTTLFVEDLSGVRIRSQKKSLIIAYLLWFFLGFLGLHRLYLGRRKYFLIYFFTGGYFFFGWLIDAFLLPGWANSVPATFFVGGSEVSFLLSTDDAVRVRELVVSRKLQRLMERENFTKRRRSL